jgi:hypothetical protein
MSYAVFSFYAYFSFPVFGDASCVGWVEELRDTNLILLVVIQVTRDVQQTLSSILSALAAENLSIWLSLCKVLVL